MATVLIISNIRVFDDTGMATGPGLRAWGIAQALAARGHQATLAEPRHGHPPFPREPRSGVEFAWWSIRGSDLGPLVAEADVVIVQPAGEIAVELMNLESRCLVVDLYNPVATEHLALAAAGHVGVPHFEWMLHWYRFFLQRGDFFLCAGERQRLFILGALSHAGRLNPLTDLDDLLRLAPMGVEAVPPTALAERVVRGKIVSEDAEVILWPGGIYGWFEGITAIRALARLRETRPQAALVFVGAENPLEPSTCQSGVAEVRAAARELGLLEAGVYFVPWQPYDARAALYGEAELAVITHRPLLEAQLSWRTRSVDCLGVGLPLVTTAGDEVGEIAAREGAAVCVPPEDPQTLARVLQELLADPARRAAMAAAGRQLAGEQWSWERVTDPVHQICRNPRQAPDREAIRRCLGVGAAAQPLLSPPLARRIRQSIQWRLSRLIPAPRT